MPDFTEYTTAVKLLGQAQEADSDNRDAAKEAHLFVTKKDGQWEQSWWDKSKGKPRYTFDQTSPIIDQIAGDIEDTDFDIKIKPKDGEATDELAQLRDGMIRNIEEISDAQSVYSTAGRNVATAGIDHWEVAHEFAEADNFDRELLIKPVLDSAARVWFDVGSQKQDRSDSKWYFLLSSIPTDEYDDRWPEGSGLSVGDKTKSNSYYHKTESVVIGHIFYLKTVERVIIRTTLGRVFATDDPVYIKTKDAMEANGEIIKDTRKRKQSIFWVRKFDGGDWLADEQETVFNLPSIIPVYGNFKVIENKTVYHGAVEKVMDPQRVLNYSLSREIEEGALAPRAKYWMTRKQAAGSVDTIQTMNTNSEPVQFYTHVDGEAYPTQSGGAQINPGLRVISDGMQQLMGRTAGIFAAGMGENPGLQSGVAIGKLQDKSNNITSKYFKSLEIAVCATGRVINGAFYKVHDFEENTRLMNEDGSVEMANLNQPGQHPETGERIVINDISQGKYIVTCKAGKSFDSRQGEANEAILSVAAVDPGVVELGSDIILKNMNAPGTDKIAERRRKQLFDSGAIPEDQMTDEELAEAEELKTKPQQPSAEMALAQAEQSKADADMQRNQITAQENQAKFTIEGQKLQLEGHKLQFEQQKLNLAGREQELDIAEKSAKLDLDARQQQFDQAIAVQKQLNQENNDAINNLNKEAGTFKLIREAMGIDAITGPQGIQDFIQQAERINNAQIET